MKEEKAKGLNSFGRQMLNKNMEGMSTLYIFK